MSPNKTLTYFFVKIFVITIFAAIGCGGGGGSTTVEENIPPIIKITNLSDGDYISGSVTVKGTANDDTGLSEVQIRLGTDPADPWNTATGTSSWSYTFNSTTYEDTSLYIQAKAVDSKDVVNFDSVTVIVDNIGPSVTIISPNDDLAVSPNLYQTVAGFVPVVGVGSKVEIVEINIDGEAIDDGDPLTDDRVWNVADGTIVWNYVLDTTAMTEGEHYVTARGRRTDPLAPSLIGPEVDRHFIVDQDTPSITITYPTASGTGEAYTGTIAAPNGTFTDNWGVDAVQLKVADNDFEDVDTFDNILKTWSHSALDTTALNDGLNTIIARVVDLTGNVGLSQTIIRVDNNPPTVSLTSHADNDVIVGDYVRFYGTSWDAVAVDHVSVEILGSGISPKTATQTEAWYCEFGPSALEGLTNGNYTVSVTAEDYIGMTSDPVEISVNFDHNNPEFHITTGIIGIAEGDNVTGIIPISNTVLDDDGDDIASVQYKLDSGDFILLSSGTNPSSYTINWNWDTDAVSEGDHTLLFRVTDEWGGYAEQSVNVVVDHTLPVASITNPEDAASVGSIIPLSGTATDNEQIAELYLDFDTDGDSSYDVTDVDIFSNLSNGVWNYSWDADAAEATNDANHRIQVRAIDMAGNESAAIYITVWKVADAPIITIASPANGSYQNETISITGNALAQGSAELVDVHINIDNTGWVQLTGGEIIPDGGTSTTDWDWQYSIDTTGLTEGVHNITARVTDNVPQTTTALLSITVDNVLPVVAITYPTSANNPANDDYNSEDYLYGTVTVTGTVTDDNIDTVEISLDAESSYISPTGTASFSQEWDTTDLTNMSQNDYILYARATDKAGNVGTTTVTVDVRPKIVSVDKTAINPNDLALYPLTITGYNLDSACALYLDNDTTGETSTPPTGGVAATAISVSAEGTTITVTGVDAASTSGPMWVLSGSAVSSNTVDMDVWTVGTAVSGATPSKLISSGGKLYYTTIVSRTPRLAIYDGSWTDVAMDLTISPPRNYGESAVTRTDRGFIYAVYTKSSKFTNSGLRWNVSEDDGASFPTVGMGDTTLNDIVTGSNIAMLSMTSYSDGDNDYLYVTWYDTTSLDLKFAKAVYDTTSSTMSSWTVSSIDDSTDDVGRYSSISSTLSLDSDRILVVSYYDYTNKDLLYTYSNDDGVTWNKSILDGADSNVGEYTDLKIGSDRSINISYFDGYEGKVKLATAAGYDRTFSIETIEDDGLSGWYTGLVLDASDEPFITCYNASLTQMRYFYKLSDEWVYSGVPDETAITFPGTYASIGMYGTTPLILYVATGAVHYATFKP